MLISSLGLAVFAKKDVAFGGNKIYEYTDQLSISGCGKLQAFHDAVVGGELSEAERDQLWDCLDIDNGFIPEYVGLEPLQPRFEGGVTSEDRP